MGRCSLLPPPPLLPTHIHIFIWDKPSSCLRFLQLLIQWKGTRIYSSQVMYESSCFRVALTFQALTFQALTFQALTFQALTSRH
ncbi:hypothetical protein JOB18_004122 [Solea senegalensis]|uniref:Uncharacterized protein n=1 Tax=Solea senegalensis TaxID=28829 RepID=A0AAV6QG58_SOLSE|nr:hypothetical protein JOB18_004122 [Solea senegalensis]